MVAKPNYQLRRGSAIYQQESADSLMFSTQKVICLFRFKSLSNGEKYQDVKLLTIIQY